MTPSSNIPNLAGDRITAFYAAIDSFYEQLRERGQREHADRLHAARNQGEYADDVIRRLRTVLRELVLSERSSTTDETIRLLVECDAIWRGEFIERANGADEQPKPWLLKSAPPRRSVKVHRHPLVGKHS